MHICVLCNQQLKSKKTNARICHSCSHSTLPPEDKVCQFCNNIFIDNSRSKNKRYCSRRCNTDAGHMRFKDRILSGDIKRPKDTRDRRIERRRRYNSDTNFKLSIALRTRLNLALKNGQKAGSAIRDLGCSIEELKKHLESKWQQGMNWENWSKDGWHIDHVTPLASFDLTDREQFLKACHYTNLQPLWAHDNFVKSDTQRTIYILAGPNGCGKTTLAKRVESKFNIIDYDNNTFNKCIELAMIGNNKPTLIVTPIQAKRIRKILENRGISVCVVYLRESRDTIVERILARNGKITPTIDKRIDRYESLKKRGLFVFSGAFDEVYDWLLTN